MTARDVLALDLHRRPGLADETGHGFGAPERLGEQELDGHPLVELQVVRRDDDPHAAHAQDPFDPILARQNIP